MKSSNLFAIGVVLALGTCDVALAASADAGSLAVNEVHKNSVDVHKNSVAIDGMCNTNAAVTYGGGQLLQCKDGKWKKFSTADAAAPGPSVTDLDPMRVAVDTKLVSLSVNVKSEGKNLITIPLLMQNGKRAFVRDGTVGSYVSSVEPCKDDPKKMCSTLSDLRTGISLEAKPRVLPNGDVAVELSVDDSTLVSLDQVTMEAGTVQLPTVSHCGFSSTVDLKPEVETLVNECTNGSAKRQVFVTAKIDDTKAVAAK